MNATTTGAIAACLATAAIVTAAVKLRSRRTERPELDGAPRPVPAPYLGSDSGIAGGLLGGTSPGRVG